MIQPGIIHHPLNATSQLSEQIHSVSTWNWVALLLIGFVTFLYYWWVTSFPASRLSKLHPMRASTFQPSLVPPKLDTIVVGSGSGGCACANLLAQCGQRVLLLEQHYRTGGCTHSFRAEGCEWDTGLHYTSKAMSSKTCRPGAIMNFMTKGLQEWTMLQDPYDEVVFAKNNQDGTEANLPSNFHFVAGKENTVQSIVNNIDPDNEELRERARIYLDLCDQINEGFTALGLTRLLPKWMHFLVSQKVRNLMTFAAMTVRDVQYAVFNLGYTPDRLLREGCPKAPDKIEPDPVLRRIKAVFTHPIGDYAVQPREATMAAHGVTMAHYRDGAAYTVGATQNISIRTSSMIREMGGEALVDATVTEIIVEHGRAVGVRVCNTSALSECKTEEEKAKVPLFEFRAKNIVWASGIYNLYTKILPKDLQPVKDFVDPEKRSVQQSNGHVFLFCKIRGDSTDIGLPTHNLWYFNCDDTNDLDTAFDKYFENPTKHRPPTVYIGFPCTKDKTWTKRFPGVSNCILISDGLWEWFEKWQNLPVHERGGDYEHFKDQLSSYLLDILYETVPETRGRVEFYQLGTPLSEVTFLSSYHGGSYGTKCTPSMFDEINHGWTTNPRTKIPGLYLAGSDAFLPAVCGAMYGGALGASAVLGHVKTFRLMCALLSDMAMSLQKVHGVSYPRAFLMAIQKMVDDD